jgi:hypothetical protein
MMVGLAALLTCATAVSAAEPPSPGDKRFAPQLEYVMSYNATLAAAEVIGPLPEGVRVNFYVTDGLFEGPNVRGRLLPVGGDWLTIRTDGIGVLDVRATLETDDKALIYISYTGVLDLGPEGHARFLEGKLPPYIPLRVSSRLHTAHPKYQWMNRHQYVQFGEADVEALTVRYDVYRMK